MPVSKEDRDRIERLVRDLERIETDDAGTPEQRRRILAVVNYLRTRAGEPPFPADDEEEDYPELGFYRRARELGMAPIARNGTG